MRDHTPYIPEWTDPEWDPKVEYSIRGDFKRDVTVDTGTIVRPAILEGDVGRNPTEFARYARSSMQIASYLGWHGIPAVVVYCCLLTGPYSRFGIYPRAKPSDEDPAVGRSLITPTIDRAADSWGEAESWQSYVFGGPTTKEVST